MASDAPTPHSPPMAKPNRARRIISTVSVGAKAQANSRPENNRMSITSTGRRPNRSASMPNTRAPKGRAARVRVLATATAGMSVWNSLAMALNMNTIRKKSKASRVQPRKLAPTAAH